MNQKPAAPNAPAISSDSIFTYYYLGDILEIIMDNISESLENKTFDTSEYVKFIKEQGGDGKLDSVIESVRETFNKSKNTIIKKTAV